MIDAITNERITIYGNGSPYLMVAYAQLDHLTSALRDSGVSFWVDEDVISLDDDPPVAIVNLGRATNVADVQHLLDGL